MFDPECYPSGRVPGPCPLPAESADDALSADESALLEDLQQRGGLSRRDFVGLMSAAGASLLTAQIQAQERALAEAGNLPAGAAKAPATGLPSVAVQFEVNGTAQKLTLDPRTTLLDALRERLHLTGSKKGCDHGQCGACTVIVDGKRVLSCLTLCAQADGRKITTIEGLASKEALHPMQAAFIAHDGFQCGYCTPGQICSAVALLEEAKRSEVSYVTPDLQKPPMSLSDDEIRERMSGNLCRCAAYPQILAAIREVHAGKKSAQTWRFAGDAELAAVRKEFAHESV